LSIESGKTGQNWLPVNELTAAIDKFVASHGDTARPSFCSRETPHRQLSFRKPDKPTKVESGD